MTANLHNNHSPLAAPRSPCPSRVTFSLIIDPMEGCYPTAFFFFLWVGGGSEAGLCQTLITKHSTPSAQDLLLKAWSEQEPKKSTINL